MPPMHHRGFVGGLLTALSLAGTFVVTHMPAIVSLAAGLSAVCYHLIGAWVHVREERRKSFEYEERLAQKLKLRHFREWEACRRHDQT
jgi:hypothetical protein